MNNQPKYFRPQVDASLQPKIKLAAVSSNMEVREWLSEKLTEILEVKFP